MAATLFYFEKTAGWCAREDLWEFCRGRQSRTDKGELAIRVYWLVSPEGTSAGWVISTVLVGFARSGDVSAGLRTRPCFTSASTWSSVSILYWYFCRIFLSPPVKPGAPMLGSTCLEMLLVMA